MSPRCPQNRGDLHLGAHDGTGDAANCPNGAADDSRLGEPTLDQSSPPHAEELMKDSLVQPTSATGGQAAPTSRRVRARSASTRALVAAIVAVVAMLATSSPALTATIRPTTLHPTVLRASATELVTISRDSRGEPHIRASSAPGASYGFAWAQMEDQALYILTAINHAIGRSAERMSSDCDGEIDPVYDANRLQACFEQDQEAHLFQVPETAQLKFSSLDADSRARYTAFAKGITNYLKSPHTNTPSWAIGLTVLPWQVLANVEYGFLMAEVNTARDIASHGGIRGTSLLGSTSLAAATPPFADTASNMFALGGAKTASHLPILEGNPHVPFAGIFQWYDAELIYTDHGVSHRVQGATFRGLPGLALGSNEHVAWTYTANHNAAHEQDVYKEQTIRDPNNSKGFLYLYNGQYVPGTIKSVAVKAKTATATKTSTVYLRSTPHGPVFSDDAAKVGDKTSPTPKTGVALAAKVSQLGEYQLGTQLMRASEAGSVADYRAAMAMNQLSGFNVMVADDQPVDATHRGNIYFVGASRSGVLRDCPAPEICPFNTVFSGGDPKNDWQGILPFADLPQAENPDAGYYQNANNAPWFTAPGQIPVEGPHTAHYYLGGGADTNRSIRQVAMLGPASGLTLGDSERIGMDTFLVTAPGLQALLGQAAADPVASDKVRAAAALISATAWDGTATARTTVNNDHPVTTAYPVFATWTRRLEADGKLSFNTGTIQSADTLFSTEDKTAAREAMDAIYPNGIPVGGVNFGDVHRFRLPTDPPTRRFDEAVSGGDDHLGTVRLTNCKNDPDAHSTDHYYLCPIAGGSSHIWNRDFATTPASPFGTVTVSRPMADTDSPASKFFLQNATDYVNDSYRVFPFTDSAISADQDSLETLTIP